MKLSSPIAAALDQLELERANLAARLEKVDALIASMRDVFHLPRAPRMNGRRAHVMVEPPAHRETNGRGSISADALTAALQRGPMTPAALAEALHVSRARLGYYVPKFVAQGLLVATGATATRRIALADRAAKEEP